MDDLMQDLSSCINYWGQVTHKCVGNAIIIGSDNALPRGRAPSHYLKFWTNAEILLIGPLQTNFSEILIKIHTFLSFKKMRLRVSLN